MKLQKIFAVALAALSMTACSDDPSWNSAYVTVSMAQTEMSISEDAEAGRYYYIPVTLSGETNGPVEVTVEFKGITESPAEEDKDFVVTQKTITIPAGELTGNIEFYPTGDNIENPDRSFEATIVSATGASIGNSATCTILLKDNERIIPEAYENIQGQWLFSGNDDGEKTEFILVCSGYDKDEDGYLKKLRFSGWVGYSWAELEANFSFDASTNQAIVSFELGQYVAEEVNFGAQLGVCDVKLGSVSYSSSGASLVSKGTISATSNEDMTELVFPETAEFIGAIYSGTTFTGYTWFWWDTMSMSR